MTFAIVLFALLAGLAILTSCSVPFTGGGDEGSSQTPVATESGGPAPTPTPTVGPQVTVETDQADWTIVTGPDPMEPPGDRGGEQVLRLTGSADAPSTIDPALVRDTSSAFLARQVFRGLTRLDGDLNVIPDLARRIEISPDGRTYRFVLHDSVTFHDGTPILAEDVKASVERALNPALTGDSATLPARTYLQDIQGARERLDGERGDIPGISVVDDRTLEIQLVRGVVDFLERLANPSTFVVDTETAEIGGDWWREANGSGPFVLDQWDSAHQIRLIPHDGYVRPPALSEVVIRVGAEAVGEMQQYESGEIDLATVPLSVIDRVDYEGSPIQGDLREVPLLSTTFVMIAPGAEPFADERLRQALFQSFPRHEIPEVMLDGRARKAEGVLPPQMATSGQLDFPYQYDPEAAADRIAQLGIGDETITIYSSGGGIPVALQHYYEETLGLNVEVVELRWQDFIDDLRDKELPMYVLTWVADAADPVTFLRALFHSESPENYSGFSDERVDELLDQAAVEQDNQRRNELINDAHQRILESAVVMPLYHSVEYTLVADHVRGLETTPMGILGLETVWIEQ